ncbi:hypothetical protein ABZ016_19960 [Streptomyces sp. NPDC006372]|uniref:hypothetical protein n=1 Tax=Streptomyces sp. NPDC006372 TaxID=3155599 RepID=UPI0033AE624C
MSARPPRDDYERLHTELLWSLIPAVYRDADGGETGPGVLRALAEAVGADLAAARRSVDRLGEDPFVERADDWAVPYLADLVATRLVSALNPRGRRVDVARTIHRRRRKGTVRILEELIADLTGWDGVVVEMYRRLGRFAHALDPVPGPPPGRSTRTPAGGLADLRSVRGAELADGPFDEYHRTADLRRPRDGTVPGRAGRHNVNRLAVHLYRIPAWRITGSEPGTPPGAPDARARTFDPSGRDVPLFQRRNRPDDVDQWRPARPWETAAPMRCRVLGDAAYTLTERGVAQVRDAAGLTDAVTADLRRLVGRRHDGEAALRASVALLPAASSAVLLGAAWQALLAAALAGDCGKAGLLPTSLSVQSTPPIAVPTHRITAGELSGWASPAAGVRLVVDPERGRMLFRGAAPGQALATTHHIGFSGPVGAGPWDRSAGQLPADATASGGGPFVAVPPPPTPAPAPGALPDSGVVRVADSRTYTALTGGAPVRALALQAADRHRPYVSLGADVVWEGAPGGDATLLLDGLWWGAPLGAPVAVTRLRGSFARVVLRHTTLDPGAPPVPGQTPDPAPVALVIEGDVDTLEIDRSVCGPVATAFGGRLGTLVLRDSVIHDVAGGTALNAPDAELDAARSTVVGGIVVNRMRATELLAAGTVTVTDTQHGCFRFGAAGPCSRLPHPYRSHTLASTAGLFTSLTFGDSGYTQLAASAPQAVARGAEDTSQIGVWSSLREAVRLDGLRSKIDEYAPFGLLPHYVLET